MRSRFKEERTCRMFPSWLITMAAAIDMEGEGEEEAEEGEEEKGEEGWRLWTPLLPAAACGQ
jgi:hypothetical protein